MATNNKTAGKTANIKKGEYKLDPVKKLQMYYNNKQAYIKEQNEKNGTYTEYHLMDNHQKQCLEKHLSEQQLNRLTELFTELDDWCKFIFNNLKKDYYLRKASSVDTTHPSERTIERNYRKEQDDDMLKSARVAEAKTHNVINKALAKKGGE